MKLKRCHITNVRALKDVKLSFSTDTNRPLTVIRAENGFGKTSLLNALRWGLFGDAGLEDKAYRFAPDDVEGDKSVAEVEVDFEVETSASKRVYRVIRKREEKLHSNGKVSPLQTTVALYLVESTGNRQIDNPDAHIAPYLPIDLKDVFFTDGDRALTFIEGGTKTQRDRVEQAIKQLLDLNLIESAIAHVGQVSADINRKVRQLGGADLSEELKNAAKDISEIDASLPEIQSRIAIALTAQQTAQANYDEYDKRLQAALRQGNREDLKNSVIKARKERDAAARDLLKFTKSQSGLFKSKSLAKFLFSKKFQKANNLLNRHYTKGDIPNQTIPVLEDRLNQDFCICGEPLSADEPSSSKRKEHIKHLIEESKKADKVRSIVTELYYDTKDIRDASNASAWIEEYADVMESKLSASLRHHNAGEAEADADARIRALPQTDIAELTQTRDAALAAMGDAQDEESKARLEQQQALANKQRAEDVRSKHLKQTQKGQRFISQLEVANDLSKVLNDAFKSIKEGELLEVSSEMNRIFTSMIGTESSDNATIKEAFINKDFEIKVRSNSGSYLTPSIDLNGASRRALTLSFILALTRKSGKEAPNVVDTPLGMTSGYVKQSIFKNICEQSSQLVLMLTPSEISNCEELIDKYAGNVVTFTNTAFYPDIVKNHPSHDDVRVIPCGCNHRESCQICELNKFAQTGEVL